MRAQKEEVSRGTHLGTPDSSLSLLWVRTVNVGEGKKADK